jgi:outer membrane protein
MKKWLCWLIIILMLIPGFLLAQKKLTLTLEKSIDLALKNNPEIKMAEKEVSKARAGVGEAFSTLLPQLDASANLSHNWKIQSQTIPNFLKPMLGPLAPPGTPDFVQISFGLENTLTYGASITQPLFLGGAGIAGIQTAKAMKRAAEYNFESKKQNLIHQSAIAFYSTLLTSELIKVQEEAFARAKANLDIVTKKYNVGTASGFDKMRAEVDMANLEPGVISSRNNYHSALTYLRNVLGLDTKTELEISGEFRFVEDDFSHMKLEQLQNSTIKNRPEILALTEQKKITQKGISIARSNFLPKLFFSTDYSFLAMKNDLRFSQSDFSEGFTSAISLQIPLFHGFRSSSQYQRAKLDHKIMLDTEKQINDGVFAEVEISFNTFNEAKQKFMSAQRTVNLAEEALRLANLMYDEGANTQLDVLSSQLALTQAKMNYVSSLYEYQISRYQVRKVTGTLKGILD